MEAIKMLTDLKKQIYRLGVDRRILAKRLGLSYSAFNSRLGEFTAFRPEEESALMKILNEAELAQNVEIENKTPFFVR
ncbi:MAG: hypothetical protein WBM07_18155 [Chitinivibrionales bacterium]